MGLIEALIEFVIKFTTELVARLLALAAERRLVKSSSDGFPDPQSFSATCGDDRFDLKKERLFYSTTFGNYFSSLLESTNTYIDLPGQIHCPAAGKSNPLEWIYRLFNDARGSRIIAIAADGGMGKTTLAVKIVRCLHQQNAIDLILGDSAKRVEIDAGTGQRRTLKAGFDNLDSFYRRLAAQSGLTDYAMQTHWHTFISDLRARLAGQRALIVLDNLDAVKEGSQLLDSLLELANRDVRILLTTREATISGRHVITVNLNPISQENILLARSFITWHINKYQSQNTRLASLKDLVDDKKMIGHLLVKTGGVPLIIQVVISKIAVEKWSYLEQLPDLLPMALLNFLYKDRWNELSSSGDAGKLAQDLLWYLATFQYEGRKITIEALREQARLKGKQDLFSNAVQMLVDSFLLVDREPESQFGNFTIFPILREFVASEYNA